jgi:RHS repeat-associated protein
MRWLFLLAFSFRLFAESFDDVTPSSSEEILSLTTDLLVDGFVSVTSGQICISETDLTVRGAQDLSLKRTYVPPRILGRYDDKDKVDRFALGKALLQLETKGWVVLPHLWAGYNRNSKYFQIRDPQGFVLEFQIQGNKGILKTASYGCSNLRGERPNSSADIRNIQVLVDGDWVKLIWPDGLQRHYLKHYPWTYRLERELLPNGKTIRYEYDSRGLSKIVSSDPTGNLAYSSISRVGNNQYVGSDGKKVELSFERREIKGKEGNFEAKIRFPVMTKGTNPHYVHTVGYNERTLLNFYDTKSYPISCTYFQNKNIPARIKTFSNPSGSFSFSYDPAIAGQKAGSTTVIHPDGAKAIYRFNKLLLLEAIENWFEGKLINKKAFSYDSKQHIKSIETLDGAGNLLIAKRFECDEAGNATLETTEGDFSVFNIKRKFDKNRIVFEEYDDGLAFVFTYLGDTRLVTSKTTLQSGVQLRKTLYFYDDANNLIGVEEEGKTRTAYTLYQASPHLHRVEWEEKRDWEGGLIYKIHYGYDQWGNTNKEDHFGSDDHLAYTILRTYNEKEELLSETNPLQEIAIYEYDSRGRCFYEEPFSNGLMVRRTFDDKGRIRLLKEGNQETRFEYNASDELIKRVDYLGFTTAYHYHPVYGKPDRIEEGSAITQVEYNPFGYPIEITNATNAKTIKKYNSYGDVVQIIHPEGGEESFNYHPNGLLKSYTNADGLTTTYTYDALGRTRKKTVGTRTTTFEYDGYNLCKMIDPAGFITTYKYDLADRKIEETREDRTTCYGYDSLGFLSWEEKGRHRTTYTNDALGRVLSKSIDEVLETFWTYDPGGNVSTIQQGGTTQFLYDVHNRLIEKVDAEGNKTVIFYAKEAQVLIEKITDPEGIETINTYNSKDQLLTKAIDGQVVETFEYDPMFRLQRQDHICFGFTPNGNREWMQEAASRTTHWKYTPGNLILFKQKPDGIVLPYRYDAQLLLTSIGSREFRYDQLGRLIGGTGFSRTLDPFGNILREEWSNGLWIETDYDELNRPLFRKLPDHSRIEYDYYGPFLKKVSRFSSEGDVLYAHSYEDYDVKGNPRIENGLFQTSYEYDKKGRRISQKNPYFIEEIAYSPSGNLMRKGNTTYAYDSLSQLTSESGKFTATYDVHYNLRALNNQSIEVDSLNQIASLEYDLNGNLLKDGFVYDEFDQLIEAAGDTLVYDALGRRIQKGKTAFLYIGDEEIGAFEQGKPTELKIPGRNVPIAIEIDQAPYVPIVDVQGVVRSLVDPRSQEIFKQNDCDAFGMGLSDEIPYAYAGKRYDPKIGLIYFGKRYYDPTLRRWLTPDPIGPSNHSNLYQYIFNNPYLYQDDHGEFAFAIPLLFWGAELALPTLSACITALTYTAAAGAVAYGGYKLVETFNDHGYPFMGDYYSGDLTPGLSNWSCSTMKSGSETTLPVNPDDLLKRPGWKETTHPDAKESGHRTFENKEIGEKLRHDEAKPGASGHRGESHWHRFNPNSKNRFDEYLDSNNNPVPRNSPQSHLYPKK